MSPEERRHRSEQFQCRIGCLVQGWRFSGSPLQHRRLPPATSRWPVAFALEGLPIDHCVTLNCGIRVEATPGIFWTMIVGLPGMCLGMNLHIDVIRGENPHHIIEACFKAFARAMDMATGFDERISGVLSTKGSL